MDVFVIRHTRLDIDGGRCYGQSEVALADSFDDELDAYRGSLPTPFCAVYSSPLERCTRLAKQFGDSIETDGRLLEYHFGDWEMSRWDDIDQAALNHWMQDFVNVSTPNGESLVQMQARVVKFMNRLRSRNHQSCLIVTHAGVIRCIWAYLLNIPLNDIFKLEVGYDEALRFHLAPDPEADLIYAPNPEP